MKTSAKTDTSENVDGDFKNGDFENERFPRVNTQKRKHRSYSAGSHVVSLDKMAVLEAFHVDSKIVTRASLVNLAFFGAV